MPRALSPPWRRLLHLAAQPVDRGPSRPRSCERRSKSLWLPVRTPTMGPMELVSGGYFAARPARRTAHMDAALLPERILTASPCLVGLAPDTWALSWTRDGDEERR